MQQIPSQIEIPHLRDSLVKLLQDFSLQVTPTYSCSHACNLFNGNLIYWLNCIAINMYLSPTYLSCVQEFTHMKCNCCHTPHFIYMWYWLNHLPWIVDLLIFTLSWVIKKFNELGVDNNTRVGFNISWFWVSIFLMYIQ